MVNGVTVTVDAHLLSDPTVGFDYDFLESTTTPFPLTVLPGTQTISQYDDPGTACNFTVALSGDVSYEPSLDGVFSGQGTTTLVVNGATVTVDAHLLSDPTVGFDYDFLESTTTPFPLTVLPGTQTISQYDDPGTACNFTVASNGDVSYEQSLDGVFGGQGTTTLVVNGVTITVDAHLLSDPTVGFDYDFLESTTTPFPLTVLPGTQTIAQYDDPSTACNFTVALNGDVSYEQSLDNVFSGQGTTTLVVNGVTITVNAHLLSDPSIGIDYNFLESTTTPFPLTVLPGTQTISQYDDVGTAFNFMVDGNGNVSFDSSLSSFLSVQNNTTLIISGVTITVDATALTNTTLQIDQDIFDSTAAAFSLTVLPGTQTIEEVYNEGTAFSFTVAADGTITGLPYSSSIVTAQGSTLVITGEPLVINATAISGSVSTFVVWPYTDLSTAQVQTLQVLPGSYSFSDPALQFTFTLSTTDQISYPTSVDNEVSGSGTYTLVILS